MNIETFREYCLSLKNTTEGFPFGDDTLVYKVNNKIYTLAGIINFSSINLKCEPEKAVELRERYEAVQPGFHMNKKHWNTVLMDNSIPDKLIFEWIMDSYNLVVSPEKRKRI